MKVLFVTGKLFSELYEGTQKSVVNLANGLVDKGHEVYWLTRKEYKGQNFQEQGPPEELSKKVEIRWAQLSKANILKIRKTVRDIEPDVINVHTSSAYMSAFWMVNFPRKTVVTVPCWRNWSRTEKLMLRFVRKTATTNSIAKKLPGNTIKTPYAVDTEEYASSQDIEVTEPTMFYIGEPSEHRGFDQACKALSKLEIDFKFKVAVAEALGDQKTAEKKLEKYGIRDKTELTIGFVDNLPEYINEGDICLNLLNHCRRTTSPPIFGLEAMSCGRIPIFSNVPEFKEIISEGENGFLVDNRGYQSIADKIEWLANHPEKANKISERARNTILEKHSVDSSVESFENVYFSLKG